MKLWRRTRAPAPGASRRDERGRATLKYIEIVAPRHLFRTGCAAFCLTLLYAAASPAQEAPQAAPDLLYVHADILTGAHLRPDDHSHTPARVQALAIRDGRIAAVGEDATILALKGPQTTVVDLHGAFLMPGFNDAHTHMAMAGEQRLAVDLVGAASLADMQSRIRTYAATAKPGQWLLGGGWDHTLWPSKTLPNRGDLDAVSAGHPALLDRVDGHIAVVNTAALQAAHITEDTPDPAGGKIDRGPDGQPTGIIREAPALALMHKVIPPPDADTRKAALRLSIQDALSHGVTSVQDFSDWDDWLILEEFEHANQLSLRFAEWIAFDTALPVLKQRRASHPADDPLLHLTQLKAFMDGSLGSRTAALDQPYSDDPANAGLPRYDQAKLNQLSAERARAGFQLGFHAIGDRANNMALNAFEAAEQVGVPAHTCGHTLDGHMVVAPNPPCDPNDPPDNVRFRPADFRFRIEHAQVVTPDAFDRFARLGVIASMQPSHLLTDMAWAGQRLGPERSEYAYAWRSFLNHNVTLAFGTDYPVESIDPFRGLYSAITRQNESGTQTFHPEQKLTLNEAVYAYTQAPAFAEFREGIKGRLEPGFLADFIVLDRDITKATPQELLHTKVLRTVVGGMTRFQTMPDPTAPSKTQDRP